jgi:hypothetical protein
VRHINPTTASLKGTGQTVQRLKGGREQFAALHLRDTALWDFGQFRQFRLR